MSTALNHHLDIDPDQPLEEWRLKLPGKGACYLLCDGDDQPILLATVGNLRTAVANRFTGKADDEPTKRVDYRAVVRRVRWRDVFSRFEGNWVYLENARTLFSKTYQKLIRNWHTQWVNVDPQATHPRFTYSAQPSVGAGPNQHSVSLGPIRDQTAARRYVDLLEDLFDLCRYHEVLQQSPHGQPCAYKEMGKCPAPCDGSITMDDYRQQIERAIAFASEPHDAWVQQQTDRMKTAAAELDFEQAGRIKTWLERAKSAAAPAYAHMAPLASFRFILFQRGNGKNKVRPFILSPDVIAFAGEMQPKGLDQQIKYLRETAKQVWQSQPAALDVRAVERLNLCAWHMLRGEREPGIFLHADDCRAAEIAEAIEQITTRKQVSDDAGQTPQIRG